MFEIIKIKKKHTKQTPNIGNNIRMPIKLLQERYLINKMKKKKKTSPNGEKERDREIEMAYSSQFSLN